MLITITLLILSGLEYFTYANTWYFLVFWLIAFLMDREFIKLVLNTKKSEE